MGSFVRIVFSDKKSGRTAQLEVAKENEGSLMGKKIGEVIEGALVGLEGFKLQITGLSDKMGSPSRSEIDGTRKAYAFLGGGPGIVGAKKGMRRRKLVRGNTISADTSQVNTLITEYGPKSLDELFPKKEAAKEQAAEAK
ncbi:MAG: 30S ribosomal protein S6e [Candidatus Micrarchaeota archaeon]|nr:30S ribosomal protein S6e [Candidatus Micrarchaeota archaeon]